MPGVTNFSLEDMSKLATALATYAASSRTPWIWRKVDSVDDTLFSLFDLDRMLCVVGIRPPFIALVNGLTGLCPWHFTLTQEPVLGCAGASRVLEEILHRKSTVVIQHVHRVSPQVAELARSLGTLLSPATVQCNGYLTPPNAVGVPPHVDQHHTLLLQLSGVKHWQIWKHADPDRSAPMITTTQSEINRISSETPPVLEVDVVAGDVLFIPRGFVHAAKTSIAHSLHLTFGISDPTAHIAADLFLRDRTSDSDTTFSLEGVGVLQQLTERSHVSEIDNAFISILR